jgi:hypothetical protein
MVFHGIIFALSMNDQIWYNICFLLKKIKLIRRQYLYHEKPKLNDNIPLFQRNPGSKNGE